MAAPDHFLAQKVGAKLFITDQFCARDFAVRAVLLRALFCGARGFVARAVLRCAQYCGVRGYAQPLWAVGDIIKNKAFE